MAKFLKHLFIFLLLISVFSVMADFVSAQPPDTGQEEVDEVIILPDTDPRVVAARIVQIALGFLGILVLGLIIYAGYVWMTSAGNAEKVEKAKNTLKNALIGLIIILSAFGIVSFIISQLTSASPSGGDDSPSDPGNIGKGSGALGSCSLESVYPEPGQEEVPRNTSIVVTFREEVDSSTICNEDPNDDNEMCDGENIRDDGRIKIYRSSADPENDSEWITDVAVQETDDHKTFVFIPQEYLGSPSEPVWHTAYLSNDIATRGEDSEGIFTDCQTDYYEWEFQVSTELDFTPPQVLEKGMFPPPDNEEDEATVESEAEKAEGEIYVAEQPDIYMEASAEEVTPLGDAPEATVEAADSCSHDGTLTVTVKDDGLTAQLQHDGSLLGEEVFEGQTVEFPGVLDLTVSDDEYGAGDSWEVEMNAFQDADTITVGGNTYTFVSSSTQDTHIELGADTAGTASNIASVLGATQSEVNATAEGAAAEITALSPGEAGNDIHLDSSDGSTLETTPMSGGQDKDENVTVNDKSDQPRNSIIQIDFNEAINPITVSGQAENLSEYIRVVCGEGDDCSDDQYFFDCGGDRCVKGEFLTSNQYATVEFQSNNQCATNACGQPVYCLPENSNLEVDLRAATLDECSEDEDCQDKSPYSDCLDSGSTVDVCVDDQGTATTSDNVNYPMADNSLLDGVMDMALNSLDGNRNDNAEGPVSYFDENDPDTEEGDNYQWSFFINDEIKIDPPVITDTTPVNTGVMGDLGESIEITFDDLMKSDSLSTGSAVYPGGEGEVEHKLINLWNYKDVAIGYWVTKENVADEDSEDEWPDRTRTYVNHDLFDDSVTYRTQAGSGVLDIYQNCFKPSDGPACSSITESQPSCCAGTAASDLDEDGNCP